MIIGGFVALLMLGGTVGEALTGEFPVTSVFRIQQAPNTEPVQEGRIFKWEQDLRWFAFRLLKDVRRYGIRTGRLLGRSAEYWLSWFVTATALLLFGGIVSAVDRRLFAQGWQRGIRVAVAYASVGLIVFLRLLRDRRLPARVRAVIPLAILYGVWADYWLYRESSVLGLLSQLLAMSLAARWFVRRCPDAIVEQHASHVRQHALPKMLLSSLEQPPSQ